MELLSHVRLFATPRTVACQAPPSMGFSRQNYWSGLPFPSPGDIPNPGIKPGSPSLQTGALPSEPPGKPLLMEVLINYYYPHLKEKESQLDSWWDWLGVTYPGIREPNSLQSA